MTLIPITYFFVLVKSTKVTQKCFCLRLLLVFATLVLLGIYSRILNKAFAMVFYNSVYSN